jgi:penicillin-insensitive murein DD-endopeptidase
MRKSFALSASIAAAVLTVGVVHAQTPGIWRGTIAPGSDAAPPGAQGTSDEEGPAVPGGQPVPPVQPEVPGQKRRPLVAAKVLFGAAKTAAPLEARAIGFYSRGCLAGARPVSIDGPAWQVMRLSRNRNWGHPDLTSWVERFAQDAKSLEGWPGLLIGDMSQPRE